MRRRSTNGGATRRGVRGGQVLAAALLLVLLAPAAAGQAVHRSELEEVRTALGKWVETRRILSAEKRDWALGKELLLDRIALVERETVSLRERIAEAEASIADADTRRAELEAENADLLAVADDLLATVGGLEERTRALLRRVPDPIRERVRPLSQRLPDDPGASRLSLGERFQNVVGILNELDKFNREITVTSEVRTLADGTAAEVMALYLGLGRGFYVTADGRSAGVGTATADGFAWTAADEAAAEVAAAVAIAGNEQVARFVRLPLRID